MGGCLWGVLLVDGKHLNGGMLDRLSQVVSFKGLEPGNFLFEVKTLNQVRLTLMQVDCPGMNHP